nr:ribonuclease H-like domain-containing protein [Tanacetum cinerariifolium]
MALALMAKAFKLNYSTPTNNNQRISSNPRNRKIVQPGMNMGQDRQMQMARDNDDYIGGQSSATARSFPPAQEPQVHQTSTASTTIADIAPIPSNSSSLAINVLITSQDVDKLNPNAMVNGNTFVNPFANSSTSAAASS